MTRNWAWALGAIILTGSALALAQQEGGGSLNRADQSGAASQGGAAAAPAKAGSTSVGGAGVDVQTTSPDGAATFQRTLNSTATQEWDAPPEPPRAGLPVTGAPVAPSGPAIFSRGQNAFRGAMSLSNGMPGRMPSKEAQAYHEAERNARQAAARLRRLSASDPDAEKAREELKTAVTTAFEARQAMQQAEVKRLKEKLAEIEAHVKRREEAKQVLIDERVYELSSGGVGAESFPNLPTPSEQFYNSLSEFPFFDASAPAVPSIRGTPAVPPVAPPAAAAPASPR